MSNITRICPQCSYSNTLDARYCGRCGHDSQANLPAERQNSLPAVIGRAAVPVLLGAASLAVSAGWKLLQGMLEKQALQQPRSQEPIQVNQAQKAELLAPRLRRTIRIRTAWAVGDSNGNWRQGQSEQTIEFDD